MKTTTLLFSISMFAAACVQPADSGAGANAADDPALAGDKADNPHGAASAVAGVPIDVTMYFDRRKPIDTQRPGRGRWRTLESNYCGNQTFLLKVDLRNYIASGPWATSWFTMYGNRNQFGPAYECQAGTQDERNFIVADDLYLDADDQHGFLEGRLWLREEPQAPTGWAARLELTAPNHPTPVVFYDNVNANYPQ